MQMDSHMVPSLWSSLEQGEGVNYRLVATDKVAEHCDNFSHKATSICWVLQVLMNRPQQPCEDDVNYHFTDCIRSQLNPEQRDPQFRIPCFLKISANTV